MTRIIMPEFPATEWQDALDALVTEHRVALTNVLPDWTWQGLREAAAQRLARQDFRPAHIGRGDNQRREADIRGDRLCWLQENGGWESAYLAWMDTLRHTLNRELFLGLREFEAHYAHYPVGAFYRPHVDRHRDSNARVISAVFYLNDHWQPDEGGELVIYDEAGSPVAKELPEGGKLALFMSEDVLHEVLPATRERWSIAGWFRR